jgi:biopolymer transport protein ExbD
MLIITIPRQNHAVEHSLGGDNFKQETPDVVVLEVDFDGTLLWNGLALVGRAALAGKMEGAAASSTPVEVHVKANRLAPYKAVAQVMSSARRAGVTRIGLVGNEQFL